MAAHLLDVLISPESQCLNLLKQEVSHGEVEKRSDSDLINISATCGLICCWEMMNNEFMKLMTYPIC